MLKYEGSFIWDELYDQRNRLHTDIGDGGSLGD